MRSSIDIEGLSHLTPIPVATKVGPLVTSSVNAGYNPGTRECPEGAAAQLANLFSHVEAMLKNAGGDWSHVARMTFYAPDTSLVFEALNEIWLEKFPDPASRLSRYTARVAEDWGDILVCCDFIAYIEDQASG